MSDYIERGAAIKAVCDCISHSCDISSCGFACSEADALSKLPAADVRLVVPGKWEYISFMTVKCSNCQEVYQELEGGNYCPNCGADMREVLGDE